MKSRPAQVGEKLVTHNFGSGTRGFAAPGDCSTAVCVLPGTEMSCHNPVRIYGSESIEASTGTFRQINKDNPHQHHDALEFAGGKSVLLTWLCEDQEFTVLQLPAEPKTEAEAQEQQRLEVVA